MPHRKQASIQSSLVALLFSSDTAPIAAVRQSSMKYNAALGLRLSNADPFPFYCIQLFENPMFPMFHI